MPNWKISLRKKVVLLALIPTLASSVIFASQLLLSANSANQTVRSLHHGYETSEVNLDSLKRLLAEQSQVAAS